MVFIVISSGIRLVIRHGFLVFYCYFPFLSYFGVLYCYLNSQFPPYCRSNWNSIIVCSNFCGEWSHSSMTLKMLSVVLTVIRKSVMTVKNWNSVIFGIGFGVLV